MFPLNKAVLFLAGFFLLLLSSTSVQAASSNWDSLIWDQDVWVSITDDDGDTIDNSIDNCPAAVNTDQVDTDSDNVGDACDAFPLDPTEIVDTDGDGVGNNADIDDDNDGVSDLNELAIGTETLIENAFISQTGQTATYTTDDDGDKRAGVEWPDPRFTLNTDNTVTDNLTGLMWPRSASTVTHATCTGGSKTWQQALSYVDCLNSTAYLGFSDWTLPNINELESLVDRSRSSVFPVNHPFVSVAQILWSSTTYPGNTNKAWGLRIGTAPGAFTIATKNTDYSVWPVRVGGGPAQVKLLATGQKTSYAVGDDGFEQKGITSPNSRFNDNGDGTVTDNLTGLTWLQDASCFGQQQWASGLSIARNLENGACNLTDGSISGEWRLPNRRELLSLLDQSQFDPSVLVDHLFLNVESDRYWSSTTYFLRTGRAWNVDFFNGNNIQNGTNDQELKSYSFYVWPVRGGYIDTDGDGIGDVADAFPTDVAASVDTDSDGYPDIWNTGKIAADSSTGLVLDVFPADGTEWADTDGDGVGDNSDVFPTDPTETVDTDGDGFGDNSDADDDNDTMPDYWERLFGFDPLSASDAALDFDNDSVTNADEYLAGTFPDDVIRKQVSAGYEVSYVLNEDGSLWGFGGGAAETGRLPNYETGWPVEVVPGHVWRTVDAGYYITVAVKPDGTLWSWTNVGSASTPAQIGTDNDWAAISAGNRDLLAIKLDGTLWAWDGTNDPVQLGSESDWHAIEAYGRPYAVRADGSLWELQTFPSAPNPVRIGTDNDWLAVSSGDMHTVALKNNGTLWSWGTNYLSQLGLGDIISRDAPEQVGAANDWVMLAPYFRTTGVLKADGSFWACGNNWFSQFGDGTQTAMSATMELVPGGGEKTWQQVSLGREHAIGLADDGSVWTWGENGGGQLGIWRDNWLSGNFYRSDLPIQPVYDSDYDYLSDPDEALAGTDPFNPDTDGDGISDFDELDPGYVDTDPLNPDTDGDGLSDGEEFSNYRTDPLLSDTDGDGLTDGEEILSVGTNPLNPDTDADGVMDGLDAFPLDIAASVDTDDDGYPDTWNAGYDQNDSTTPLYLDAFPLDSTEWADADSDGYGDNGDVYPNDPTEWADADSDNLPDNFESNNFGNLTSQIASDDPDGDGLTNLAEFGSGTDPNVDNTSLTDTDGDGIPDVYETANGLDLNDPSDVLGNADSDNYSNYHEYLFGLDPQSSDSGLADADGDGMPDQIEITLGTNPTVKDASEDPDGDMLSNLEEMHAGTLPLVHNGTMLDTDGDGIPDQAEILAGTDPNFDDADLDLDADGIANIDEYYNGTLASENADLADSDSDGLPDQWEQGNGLDVDTDNTGIDSDGDNVTDVVEYYAGTSPISVDTDGDGINDDVDLFPLDPTPLPPGLSHAPNDRGNKGVKRKDGEKDNDNKVNGKPKRDVPFVFHVVVHEASGNAPARVLVHINGYENELIKVQGDVATGAIYELEKLLGPAQGHAYSFTAEDLDGNILWSLPLAGDYAGPSVELLNGKNMVGVSCDVRSTSLDAMTGLGSSSCFRWSSIGLSRDDSSGAYLAVDDSGPLTTGEGYFVSREANATLPDLTAMPQVGEASYTIDLQPGWNLISVPYNGYVKLSDIEVQKSTETPVTWSNAVTSKWLTNAIYTYDGEDWGGTYSFDFPPNAELVPWAGYWVYLNLDNADYKLIVPQPAQ